MAFTIQEEAVLRAILNGTLGAGFTTEQEFQGAMTLVKLQNELNTLSSQLTNLVKDRDDLVLEKNALIEAKQAEVNAKQEEINAYIANLA